jgi:hypothetical protein
MFSKKNIAIAILLLALIGIPSTLLLSHQRQEARSRAAASTTLSLSPASTAEAPMQKNVGDSISYDVIITPGSNMVSFVKLELVYDPSLFAKDTTPFVANTAALPTKVEGPVVSDGKIVIALSIGADPSKAIQKETKVGTLTLKAKAASESATQITFGSATEVRSVAPSDQASENILAAINPAYIMINGTTYPSVSVIPQATTLSFTAFLHGIGDSGDNANPTASTLSNKKPLHETRSITVSVYNDQNVLASTGSGTISYKNLEGIFAGSISFGDSLPKGFYTIKVKEPTHLRRLLNGIISLAPQQENKIDPFTLVAGDINDDNMLNTLDYNLLIGCYSDLQAATACDDTSKIATDLNDDGATNQYDYNLFLREVTVQNGN